MALPADRIVYNPVRQMRCTAQETFVQPVAGGELRDKRPHLQR